jgi:hypothetical protein
MSVGGGGMVVARFFNIVKAKFWPKKTDVKPIFKDVAGLEGKEDQKS